MVVTDSDMSFQRPSRTESRTASASGSQEQLINSEIPPSRSPVRLRDLRASEALIHLPLKTLAAGFAVLALGFPPAPVHGEARPAEAQTHAAVEYALGFRALEQGRDGSSWRWIGAEAVIRLSNTHRDMLLTIKGVVPAGLPRPSTISLAFNGVPLDQLVGVRGAVLKKYEIPASRQGTATSSRLRITSSQTFVPHEIDPQSPDRRRLGFAVVDVTWERH